MKFDRIIGFPIASDFVMNDTVTQKLHSRQMACWHVVKCLTMDRQTTIKRPTTRRQTADKLLSKAVHRRHDIWGADLAYYPISDSEVM